MHVFCGEIQDILSCCGWYMIETQWNSFYGRFVIYVTTPSFLEICKKMKRVCAVCCVVHMNILHQKSTMHLDR